MNKLKYYQYHLYGIKLYAAEFYGCYDPCLFDISINKINIFVGSLPRYHVGDQLNISCISPNSVPAAKLKWFINGEYADSGRKFVQALSYAKTLRMFPTVPININNLNIKQMENLDPCTGMTHRQVIKGWLSVKFGLNSY